MISIALASLHVSPDYVSPDWRDAVYGEGVPLSDDPSQYYNQPLSVQLANGSWLVVLTNAGFTEGEPNQRVVSRLHPSPDLTDPLWLPSVDIENQPWGPSAGWVVPLYAPALNRVYAIYTFNEGISRQCRTRLTPAIASSWVASGCGTRMIMELPGVQKDWRCQYE